MPGAGQIDRLLAGEANEPGHVDVNERESWAGAPVAKQPRLDVLSAERPLQQRVVFQVDLPDREVVAGSPPRINRGQLAIGKGSKFVSGQFQGHTSSLVRDRRSIEGRRSLVTAVAEPEATLKRFRRLPARPPAQGCSVHRSLRPPLHAELGEQAGYVVLDGLLSQEQPLTDAG